MTTIPRTSWASHLWNLVVLPGKHSLLPIILPLGRFLSILQNSTSFKPLTVPSMVVRGSFSHRPPDFPWALGKQNYLLHFSLFNKQEHFLIVFDKWMNKCTRERPSFQVSPHALQTGKWSPREMTGLDKIELISREVPRLQVFVHCFFFFFFGFFSFWAINKPHLQLWQIYLLFH